MSRRNTSLLRAESVTVPVRVLPRPIALLFIGAIVALGVWGALSLRTSNKISDFLPAGEDPDLALLSSVLTESELIRTIVLDVEAPSAAVAAASAKIMSERLVGVEGVAWVRSGFGGDQIEAIRSLYFDRRLGFVSDDPDELTRLTSQEGLRDAARDLKRQLGLPTATLVRSMAQRDPLQTFMRQVERFSEFRVGHLDLVDGQLVTRDGRHGIVFVATTASPFDAKAYRPVAAAIDTAFEAAKAAGATKLERSGVHGFAAASERAIRRDVTRISTVSSIGIALMFFVVFGRIRFAILPGLPIGAGFAVGVAALVLIFDSTHGIAFAFGSAMMGVSVDYAVHLIGHHAAQGGDSAGRSVARVWRALVLGCATTVAGLVGMMWASFPGIAEIAVFSSVGVAAALFTTRYLIPPFLPTGGETSAVHARLIAATGVVLEALSRRRRLMFLLLAPVLGLVAVGLPMLQWDDTPAALNRIDEALHAEDERVRARVSRVESGQLVVAIGDTEEAALAVNDRVFAALDGHAEVSGFKSLHSLLWSAGLQRANRAKFVDTELRGRFDDAFAAEGFRPAMFGDVFTATTAPPLTFADLAASPLGPIVRPFRVDLGGRVAFLTFLEGLGDADKVESSLAGIEGARLFEQHRFLARAYGAYRKRTLQLVALGLVLVFLLVLAYYRNVRLAAAAFAPALIAGLAMLGLAGVLGMTANLMHLVALLLVLSMGVDYGVFMVEHRQSADGRSVTFASITIACATTLLSFGTLAVSDNPALSALGFGVGVGVLIALWLAPTALLLAGVDDGH